MLDENKRFDRGGRRPFFAFLAPLIIFLIGAVVMWLWNAILPQLVSANRISYWQAIGLFLLCRILFGGLGFKGRGNRFEGSGSRWANNWRNKWHNMSDEERTQFKDEWRRRCEERRRGKQQ